MTPSCTRVHATVRGHVYILSSQEACLIDRLRMHSCYESACLAYAVMKVSHVHVRRVFLQPERFTGGY